MSHDDLTARLRATFLQELEEQIRELNDGLLALEQVPGDEETIRTMFRSAHTIKGAARVVGVPVVEEACHALESVFAGIREGLVSLDGAHFSLLFAVVDALSEAGARLRRNDALEGGTLAALLPHLNAMVPSAGAPRPDAAGSPVQVEAGAEARATPSPGNVEVEPRETEPVVQTQARAERRTTPSQDRAAGSGAGVESGTSRGDGSRADDGLVRVRADRLDMLLSAVGELIVATGRVADRAAEQDEDTRRLRAATSTVADVVRHLRLRPFADVCEALPRAARDIAASQGKEIELELTGQDVEADRLVVDALREPLLHLVRNAVDHGIEMPDERERNGKTRTGRVRVGAELSGGRMVVKVEDDGAGVDANAVAEAMRARGLPVPRNAGELAQVLMGGGISSRREATTISGRGVGLDLVRAAVERIGGTVDIGWRRGGGTRFTLECPPTPATIRALLFRLGQYTFALPSTHVERLRRITPDQIRQAEGRSVLTTRRGPLSVHMLASLLGPPLESRPIEGSATLIIVVAGGRRAGLIVDEALAEEEIVVRPLDVDDGVVPYASGAAILPTGRVALVLGAGALLSGSVRAGTAIAPTFAAQREAPRRRILVADDSITTRTLEQSVLEAAGYDVTTAVNGEDAWNALDREGADMLVADVEMPRMDGFTLCRRVRASQRFSTLPIVLVTGLSSDQDRARGLEAGADAYIVKSGFDQATLLKTVQQLIGDS
ncbi:response regulator [soil metagenome]